MLSAGETGEPSSAVRLMSIGPLSRLTRARIASTVARHSVEVNMPRHRYPYSRSRVAASWAPNSWLAVMVPASRTKISTRLAE